MSSMVRRFRPSATSFQVFTRECRAGVATFLTMSYIIFVNPSILAKAIPVPNAYQQLLTATALSAAIATFLMAALARYPFTLAPGMGLNAFFTFSVVIGMGVSWKTALAAVFVS